MDTTTSTQDNETFPQSLDEVVGFAPMVCSESKEDVATKATTVCIVINATPNIPEGFFSINLEKSLILKNWKGSMIANALEGEPEIQILNLNIDPCWLTDYNSYALKKVFYEYINYDDRTVPEPKWIADGSEINHKEHCGNKQNYKFIMSFGSEVCFHEILSKYPQYAFPPNEEDEIGGLIPGSYDFWYSLKEADAEFDAPTTEQTEAYLNATFPKELCDEFRDKILPEGETFMQAFDCNEFEVVKGMVQLVGVSLFKDLASIGEYLGLIGLVRLSAMLIGEQIRYWPKVESCIEQVYEQRIADIRKEVEEEEAVTAAGGAAAAAAVEDDDEDDDDDDDDDDSSDSSDDEKEAAAVPIAVSDEEERD